MAARAVGATTIVAIDIVPSRLEMAKELGATHAINSKQTNPVEAIRDITGGGVDYSLEASGDPRAVASGDRSTRISRHVRHRRSRATGHRGEL
jgi:aryl-alcohol dehydrogenase